MKRWIETGKWISRACSFCLVCSLGLAAAAQPDHPGEPIGWDVLPNGLIEVRYDESRDGIPDHVTLHQVVWSGWTSQPLSEIEAQAAADGQWVFIVEYDQDRFVYLAKAAPLFWADDPAQRGDWTVIPVELLEDR